MEHPYKEFEGLVIWQSIDRAIADLEKNQDITLTTAREYVVGYLCECLTEGYSDKKDSN